MQTTLEAPKRSTTIARAEAPDALDREPSAAQLMPRINIPVNLENWKHLPDEVSAKLLWFHQHLIDANISYKGAAKGLGYDTTVVFRALKGTYEGNWEKIAAAIERYQRETRNRSKIQNVEFVHNRNTKLIFDALDYAVASRTITLIIGESGMSKTMSGMRWRDEHNSGRTLFITVPPICTSKTLLKELCDAIGAKGTSTVQMLDKVKKALNKGRTIIADEAHRLLPANNRSMPLGLEILRDLHDKTGCGLALIATARFGDDLTGSEYQFEQVLGRIGMPTRLFREIRPSDIKPILEQYFHTVTEFIMDASLAIANNIMPEIKGRIRALVEVLRHASRISADERGNKKMTEQHFKKALGVRKQMMGDFQYAKH